MSQLQKRDRLGNPIAPRQANGTHEVMLDNNGIDMSRRKRTRKLFDPKAEENSSICQIGRPKCDTLPEVPDICIDSPALSGTMPMTSSETIRSSDPALTQDYDIECLRRVLREQLQNATRPQRLEALSGLSELSLQEVCQSHGLRTEIRIFRARYHLACLEEIWALGS